MAIKKKKKQRQNWEIITIDTACVPIYYGVWHSYDNVYYIPRGVWVMGIVVLFLNAYKSIQYVATLGVSFTDIRDYYYYSSYRALVSTYFTL